MKNFTLALRAFFVSLLMLLTMWGSAQNPTYENRLMNDTLVNANTYEFDIYLLRTGATSFELATYQMGLYYDPAITNGGTITASVVAGFSDLLGPQQPTTASVATGTSGKFCMAGIPYGIIRLAAKTPPGPGNGTIISNVYPGMRVGRIRLTNTVAFGQAIPIKCFNFEPLPYNTVVRAYVGTINTDITVQASHFITDLTNPLLNAPVPVHNVTGGGNTPANVGLDGSDLGIRYWVLRDAVSTQWPTNGTGAALNFNGSPFTLGGTYTSTAWRKATYLTANMSGNAVVVACVVPTVYNVSGGGSYCSHMGSTVPVYLSGSEVGHNYQLKKDGVLYGSVVPGTGLELAFSNLPGGTYGIVGDPGTSCETAMNGTVVVTEITSPVVYNATGGGPYCAGGTGMTVTLSGSQVGVKYQLKKNTVDEGLPLDGTGAPLSWNNMTTGNYTVNAYFPGFVCEINMGGNVNVWVDPVPNVYTLSGGGTTCNMPTNVWLDNSQVNYLYTLYKDAVFHQGPVTGTGAAMNFFPLPNGTYTIKATNPSGTCETAMSNSVQIIYETPPSVYTVAGSGTYCSGGLGLPVTLSNSQIGVNYQLKQNGVNFGAPMPGTGGILTWNNNPAGTYTVVATNNGGVFCTSNMTGSAVITAENPVGAAGAITGPATVTQFDLGVAYSVAAITNATSYVWTTTGTGWTINNGTTNTPNIDFSGTATSGTLTVKGHNSCGDGVQSDKAITVNPMIGGTITINTVTPVNPTCNGGSNGSITIAITAVGTTNPILYSIDNGATWFNNSGTFTGLTAGSYNIKVKDSGVATATWAGNPVILTQPTAISITNVAKTNVSCNGGNNGTITITASGGTGALQYSINNGSTWQASNSFNNLTAGNYNVKVKDANACEVTYASNPVVITEPTVITISNVTPTNVTCNGGNNGSITITASGGTGALQYSINNGTSYQASGVFNSLTAGNYNVKVKDANNCIITYAGNPVVITQPAAIVISNVAHTNLTCFGVNTGTITITASGGTGALQYSINNGATYQASNIFNNLAAGGYQIRVKDANNCVAIYASNPVFITQPPAIVISSVSRTNVSCFGGNDGSISIVAYGGTGLLQYSVNNGVTWTTSNVILNLPAGSYTVIVKDASGCTKTYSGNPVVITEPPQLLINSVVATNVSCYGTFNGTITITASGGTGAKQYTINNGVSWSYNPNFTGLGPGSYYVRVKDLKDCEVAYASNPVVITQPGSSLSITNITSTNVNCNGANNGTITITATGGTLPYQYSINNGATWFPNNAFTNLAPGSYAVRVKDANNCIAGPQAVQITQPSAINITNVAVTNVSCAGANTGKIVISASGGTPPRQYSIDNGTTWSTSNVFANLVAGNYFVKVKDANNCEVSYAGNPVVITAPPAIIISNVAATNVYCYGGNTGSIFITASGGTGALTYSINNGSTYFNNGGFFTGLAAGTYNVIVKDASGCTQAYSGNPVILSQPPEIVISSVTSTNVSCGGTADGTITIVASGGTGVLFYSIDGGYTWFNNGGLFTGLTVGSYEVRVMDEIGCFVLYSGNPVVITQEPNTIVYDTVIVTHETCPNCNDGTITINVSGGTPPFEYSIDDGANWQASNYFAPLAPGDYTVKVKDSEGCTLTYPNNPVTVEIFTDIPEISSYVDIQVYPNPTDGLFTLDIKGISQVLQIQIMNLEGKMVAEKRGPFGAGDIKVQFNLNNEPTGQYLVRIIEQNSVHVRKVAVQ